MRSNMRFVPVAALSVGALMMVAGGCQAPQPRHQDPYVGAQRTPAPRAEQRPLQAQQQPQRRGQVFGVSEMSFPTGDDQTSLVRVTATSQQDQVRVGQTYVYQLEVTNLSNEITLENVTIHQDLPGTMQIAGVRPEGLDRGAEPGEWNIGHLSPGQTKAFEVALVPQQPGQFETCVRVTYNPVLCTVISVVAPELRLMAEAPQRVSLCDPIPVRFTIGNTGSGSTEQVIIQQQLPQGITGPDGRSVLEIPVGPLEAGQTREFTVNLRAERPGEIAFPVIARSADGLEAQAQTQPILVWAPVLDFQIQGPQDEFIGTPLQYRAMITNNGNGPAVNTTLHLNLPARTRLVNASVPTRGAGQDTEINIGDLPQGESREVMFTVEPGAMGPLELNAMATAYCANRPQQSLVTNIRGVTSLLLEVVDNNDPIRVGEREIYQIGVANQGSVSDHDVRIVVIIPDGMEFLDATGATNARVDGNRVEFEPVRELGPNQRVVWNVATRAVRPGDYRFQTQLTSRALTEPVIETEATRAY